MSVQQLFPTDPSAAMVIREVVPGITTLSLPFKLAGRVKTGARTTIVRLQTGSLAIFSPVPITPDVRAKVSSLGAVRYIIAPNREHHLNLTAWAQEYPSAEIIGPEGLPEKRESNPATKGLTFSHVFTTAEKHSMTISAEFDAEFAYEYVHSHRNGELVFLHKPTRTLIQADLLYNLPATEQFSKSGEDATSGFLTMTVGGILNTKMDSAWQKRTLWYGAAAKDRAGFTESIKRIQEWDYDRIIPCHGDVIETGGKDVLHRVMDWFLVGKNLASRYNAREAGQF